MRLENLPLRARTGLPNRAGEVWMKAVSIPALVMAGITFYLGFHYLLLYVKRRDHREYLTFALTCLFMSLYDVLCAGLYQATSVREGLPWQRLQIATLGVGSLSFLWFISDYASYRRRNVLNALSMVTLPAAAFQRELIATFLGEAEKGLADLESAVVNRDGLRVKQHAHRIKGSSANAGAQRLQEIASEIEEIGDRGDFGSVQEKLVEFKAGFEKVRRDLEQYAKRLESLGPDVGQGPH